MNRVNGVLVLIGLPGAGKTTVANRLAFRVGARHKPIDRYREEHAPSLQIANDLATAAAAGPVVFECTGAGEDFEEILAQLSARGVASRVVILEVAAETALVRAAKRVPAKDPKVGRSWSEHVDWVRTRLRLVPTDAEIDCEAVDPDAAASEVIDAWTREESSPDEVQASGAVTFSGLSKWQVCGREYAYQHIQRLAPSAGMPPVVEVGSAAHEALAWLLAPCAIRRGLSEFLAVFDSKFTADAREGGGTARAWGRQLLAEFYSEQYAADTAETLAVEAEVALSLNPRISLTGRLDRLARVPAGELEVTEFKLRESRHRSRPRMPELLQPAAYAAAVMAARSAPRAFAKIHFLEQRRIDRVLLNEAGAANVRAALLRWIAALQRKRSAPHPGHHCRHCGYRLVCPQSAAKTASVFDSVATR